MELNIHTGAAMLDAMHDPAAEPLAAIVDQLQDHLMRLVHAAIERARHAAPAPAAPPAVAPALPLSERELEVLRHIAAGSSNKLIARALGLSPHTVKRHVANILDKLGARSRIEAATWLRGR